MSSPFLAALERRVLVFDGSMGATLQNMPLEVESDYLGRENCVDVLVRSRPELIQSIHESFLEVGADCVETDTFGGARHVLREFDDELASWCRELNREAAEVARAACDAHSTKDKPRFVIGSMGPGTKLITLGQIEWDQMLDSYAEQARGLIDGGADAFVIETCQDLLQVKCAINAVLEALDEAGKSPQELPILVSVTIETMGTMLLGTEIAAALQALRPYPIASLGLNCATGPAEMVEHVEHLARHWDRAISVIPNAGLPVLADGKTSFPLRPESLGETIGELIETYGVDIVGGCCGTGPEHIAEVARAVERSTKASREPATPKPSSTSLYGPVEHRQENSFLNIGERMNASGSRKFKRLLEEEAWDEIVTLARDQVKEGANVLDVNTDYAGRDNARDMAEIVQRVVRQVNAPLMIDSTQVATIEAGLRHAPGKCLINSTNFEDGEERFDEVCRLAKVYGAGLVIGTIDEDQDQAMARTAERKHSIAARAIERATEVHGLDVADLFIDPLALPISTGMADDRRSGLELVEGVRRIAEAYPDVQITCGLSNVSFGLKPQARVVLNSVLLHELLEAGLTSAIVHASKILPLNRIPDEQKAAALDLIRDRRAESAGGTGLPESIDDESFDPLGAYIDLFDDVTEEVETVDRSTIPIAERLRDHIIDGEKKHLHEDLDEALEQYGPLEIINEHLLGGMQTVGELFGSGQMQLPFVLQSAETMKMAVAHLEPHMEKVEGETKGTIVLATVKGDVHDIGKNLVDIILSNNGYTVHNIGIKQPINAIVEAIEKHRPNAVGLSGLLVKSVVVMEENLKELNERNIDLPVILGGAALSRHYAEGHLRSIYHGPMYYGKDAFEGMKVCDHIVAGSLNVLDEEIAGRLAKRQAAERVIEASKARRAEAEGAAEAGGDGEGGVAVAEATATETAADTLARDHSIPEPPFWGSRVIEGIRLDEVFPYINPVALFRAQWGFKKGSRSEQEYEAHLEEHVYPVFDRLKAQCRDEEILVPRVVYGYWPAASQDDDLVIFDPDDHGREIERFTFPRQSKRERRCLADYARPIDDGERDVVGFTCVTVGDAASDRARALFEDHQYTEYLYLHGLSVETAEALAEMWHKRMRAELGIDRDDGSKVADLFRQHYRGARYSPGYPACPEMSDQEIIFRLLDPSRIGCELTENWQIDPEQSTSAIVMHHPQARYFNV